MNNPKNLEELLTPSAKEALDEIILDQRNKLLEKAYSESPSFKEYKTEISLRDILEARDEIFIKKSEEKKTAYRKKRLFVLIALTGVLYTIAGLLIYLFQNRRFDIESDLGILIVVIGILVTIVGFFFNQYSQTKNTLESNSQETDLSSDPEYLIVERWKIIESILKSNYEKNYNKKPYSFNQLLDILKSDYRFKYDNELHNKINILLNARNKVIHESYKMNKNKLNEYLREADEIIEKLDNNK